MPNLLISNSWETRSVIYICYAFILGQDGLFRIYISKKKKDIYFISWDKICVFWTQNFIFWVSLVFRALFMYGLLVTSLYSWLTWLTDEHTGNEMQDVTHSMWLVFIPPFCHPGNYRWLWQHLDFGHQKWKPCLVSSSVRWDFPPSWHPVHLQSLYLLERMLIWLLDILQTASKFQGPRRDEP